MSENTNHVPPIESSLDSQLTENNENRPHADTTNINTKEAQEAQTTRSRLRLSEQRGT